MEFIFIFALMKVYFYHTQDIQRIMREWGEGRFPGHYLYGATQLGDHGIDVVSPLPPAVAFALASDTI